MQRGADFSPCRRWRYRLWRQWGDGPVLMVIGLNPSTADEMQDDPTIRRCIGFARSWGFGRLEVLNLFAWRATRPQDLWRAQDPLGPDNRAQLLQAAARADLRLAAWGNHGAHLGQADWARARLKPLYCLAVNASGEPAHPLYQPASRRPRPYS